MASLNYVAIAPGGCMSLIWHQAIAWTNTDNIDLLSVGPSLNCESKYDDVLLKEILWKSCLNNVNLVFLSKP